LFRIAASTAFFTGILQGISMGLNFEALLSPWLDNAGHFAGNVRAAF
jgi:hypothetical protein